MVIISQIKYTEHKWKNVFFHSEERIKKKFNNMDLKQKSITYFEVKR